MNYERILRGAEEFCADCDDTFDEVCAEAGHSPLITDADFHWEICGRCRGDGTLGGYPGVYTSDDFAEDPDFFDDYIAYRRTCEDCGGSGKVRGLSQAALERPAVQRWICDVSDSYATERQERMMGA